MNLQFFCSFCNRPVVPGSPTAVADLLLAFEDLDPWSALGDGETFEDLLSNTLTSNLETACPQCGNAATPAEGALGRLSSALLASW